MKRIFRNLLVTVLFIAVPSTVNAQGPDNAEPGFSGRVQAGAIYLQTDSQLSTENDNRRTDDLDEPADTHDLATGLASVYLRYQFEGGTAIYAGNPLEVGQGFSVAAGVSRPMTIGTLDVAATWLPISEVWKNPYQTVIARSKTDVDVYGLRVQLEEIAGSPWEVTYQINRINIEDDVIGDLEDDLERNGLTHELEVQYTLPLRQGVSLSPELSYTRGDIDGKSNSYDGVTAGLLLQGAKPPWVLIGLVSGFHNAYKKTHPVFGKTRRESGVTAFAQVMRLNLFGVEDLFASLGAGVVWADANIDFYDSRTVIGLASVGYNF